MRKKATVTQFVLICIFFCLLLASCSAQSTESAPQNSTEITTENIDAVQQDSLSADDGETLIAQVVGDEREYLNSYLLEIDRINAQFQHFNSLYDVQQLLSFPIAQISYVPDGYKLTDVVLDELSKDVYDEMVRQIYTNDDSKTLYIQQTYVGPNYKWHIKTTEKISDAIISGNEAICIENDTITWIHWKYGDYKFEAFGDISKPELLLVANSVEVKESVQLPETQVGNTTTSEPAMFSIDIPLPQTIDESVSITARLDDGFCIGQIEANPSELQLWELSFDLADEDILIGNAETIIVRIYVDKKLYQKYSLNVVDRTYELVQ